MITKLFDALVEPKLIQPTYITGYPAEVSPLSRRSDTHPELTGVYRETPCGRRLIENFVKLSRQVVAG